MGRILVVEDDQTFGEALCQVLSRAGYVTTLATDFQTALAILEAEQPLDLLLVDIVMPDGINGIALSRMARHAPARTEGHLYHRLQHSRRGA